eukprot:TRINITY_DN138207_c0_g1_i1.p5 TRINITY_DN138207_c0_g1~~TRINITY_DN138207_c0_g1_i1.p5  ORF type:complete len:111 (+),score=3.71 TRINITY_DN138207_c0_g1_i1:391-723(+)
MLTMKIMNQEKQLETIKPWAEQEGLIQKFRVLLNMAENGAIKPPWVYVIDKLERHGAHSEENDENYFYHCPKFHFLRNYSNITVRLPSFALDLSRSIKKTSTNSLLLQKN